MLDDYLHAEFTRLGVHRLNIVSIKGCYTYVNAPPGTSGPLSAAMPMNMTM
jgi:hypothetical protein